MPNSRIDFDLAVFDIDGTLLATDEFWVELGRRAVATVYERHSMNRELPPTRRFVEALGLPMNEFWEFVLPEEAHSLVGSVEEEAQELEAVAFTAGLGAMYPGARELLVELRSMGKEIALASNCGRRYLEGFLSAFELRALISEARCFDSPATSSKVDMLADILRCCRTSQAVMVGDRDNDRQAARANGVPFVLFTGGFTTVEPADGDHVAPSYAELRKLLVSPDR